MEQEVKKDLENVQETSEPANSKTKEDINIFIHIVIALSIVGAVIRIFKSLMQATYGIDGAIAEAILYVALIVSLICLSARKKLGVYLYFCALFANAMLVYSNTHRISDIILYTVIPWAFFAALLCLRKGGRSAWKVIFNIK